VFEWYRKRKAAKKAAEKRESIKRALFQQACAAIEEGHRFQFRVAEIGGDPESIQSFVVKLTFSLGKQVRASCGDGFLTIYGDDDGDDGVSVVVATVER
jgi:hypothetical protein